MDDTPDDNLFRFEFARMAREHLGLRMVARGARHTLRAQFAVWYDVQLDVGNAKVDGNGKRVQHVLCGAAHDYREWGVLKAIETMAAWRECSPADWREYVRAVMRATREE